MRLDSGPIPELVSITADSMTFSTVTREHAGVYGLSASNEAGNATGEFEIIVLCELRILLLE